MKHFATAIFLAMFLITSTGCADDCPTLDDNLLTNSDAGSHADASVSKDTTAKTDVPKHTNGLALLERIEALDLSHWDGFYKQLQGGCFSEKHGSIKDVKIYTTNNSTTTLKQVAEYIAYKKGKPLNFSALLSFYQYTWRTDDAQKKTGLDPKKTRLYALHEQLECGKMPHISFNPTDGKFGIHMTSNLSMDLKVPKYWAFPYTVEK